MPPSEVIPPWGWGARPQELHPTVPQSSWAPRKPPSWHRGQSWEFIHPSSGSRVSETQAGTKEPVGNELPESWGVGPTCGKLSEMSLIM